MYHIPSDDEDDFDIEPPRAKLFERKLAASVNYKGTTQPETTAKLDKISESNEEGAPYTKLKDCATVQLDSENAASTLRVTSDAVTSKSVVTSISSTVQTVTPATTPASAAPDDSQLTTGGGSSSSAYRILVNKRQKGNPLLKSIRNIAWEFDAIVPDYEMGRCTCALFLSLKYHNRFPEYIHSRLKDLGKSYDLRILLVLVDTKQQDVSYELNQLARICILADCTLILAFSFYDSLISYEEAGRYLEVYKAYENKPPTDIMGRTSADYLSQATDCLTSIKGINKTDVTTLLTRFKNLKSIIKSDIDSLSLCPGIGPLKARRLHAAFTTDFIKQASSKPVKRTTDTAAVTDEDHHLVTSDFEDEIDEN